MRFFLGRGMANSIACPQCSKTTPARNLNTALFFCQMNIEPDDEPALSHSPGTPPPPQSHPVNATQPFLWSVRREVWENRSVYLAPSIVAVVLLFGFLVTVHGLPGRRRAALLLDPLLQRAAIALPYNLAAIMILVTAFVVGVFYCLDALYGERRDRSILFWKSLPVSDLTTVLSKVTIPLLVMPIVSFVIIVATQLIMLLASSAVLFMSGISPATTWTNFPFLQQSLILLYSLAALALWHAPIYGWLLLVSGWVRRAAFLWAVLPLFVISVFEKVAFDTSHFASMVRHRLMGFAAEAFAFNPHGNGSIYSLAQLTPGKFLGTPDLWVGLVFAAIFLAAAICLRRYRGAL
jgi:ABC-2 type transport system permease protein